MSHNLKIRVYYEDTDAGGIVYYANYLKFAERGRTELLRSIGYENKALMDADSPILFVVRRIEADYHGPAALDDLLEVRTATTEIRNASFTMEQEIAQGDTVLFAMKVQIACINNQGRPVRVPEELKKALTGAG